jgi:sulfur-carrier protein adenylyltransferase/sulfurtransferase
VSVRVQLPMALREYTGGASEVDVDAADIDAALDGLASRHPLLRRHLFTDAGRLRGYVRVYLNDDDVETLAARGRTPVGPGDVLLIVPSIAGGAPQPAAPFDSDEVARYARHIALPELGWEGQRKLRSARVAIVGVGGLGSPAALYLCAAGVGTIGLIDFDVVDVSNLQRQVIYGTADVGRRKVDVAATRLRQLNPHVDIVTHAERLTRANALEILEQYDVVIDGTDNFPTRYLVSDACVMIGRPYVYGSILRFEGQVAVFTGRTGPCYRCLFREPPPPGLVPSCAEGGVLGVLPGIIGSAQALETIKLIIDRGSSMIGRLGLFDALTFRWRELKLRRDPACPVCGDSPTVTGLIDYDEFCGYGETETMNSPRQHVQDITPLELKQRLDNGEPLLLIDVREPFEWDIANLSEYGARLIPLGDVLDSTGEIDPQAEIVLYCRTGARSGGAARQLSSRGYERVWNLKGGINRWAEEVDPGMTSY